MKMFLTLLMAVLVLNLQAQQAPAPGNDTNTPLHALQPDYTIPYGKTTPADVKQVLDRVLSYLDAVTPAQLINSKTTQPVRDLKNPDKDVVIKPGDFRLTSYEWGVTYGAMLLAGEVTGDKRYTA